MKNHLLALLLFVTFNSFCQQFDILRTQNLEKEADPRYTFKTNAVAIGLNYSRLSTNNKGMDGFNYTLSKYAPNIGYSSSNWGKKTQSLINVGASYQLNEIDVDARGFLDNGQTRVVQGAVNGLIRRYNDKNQYIEGNFSANLAEQFKAEGTTVRLNDENNVVSVGARFGLGRINAVDHLFNAHFLVEKLVDLGFDVKSITDEEFIEIASLLSQNSNYSFGGQTNEQTLQKLMDIISGGKDLGELRMKATKSIIASHTYFNGQLQRLSGRRFSLGLAYSTQGFLNDNDFGRRNFLLQGDAAFEVGRSLSKNFHLNFNLGASFNAFDSGSNPVPPNNFDYRILGGLIAQLNYFFNPRYMLGVSNNLIFNGDFVNTINLNARAFVSENINFESSIGYAIGKANSGSGLTYVDLASLRLNYRF